MTAKNVWTVLKVPSFVIICVEHVIGSLSWSQGYRVMYFQVCPALIPDPCLCSLSLEAMRLRCILQGHNDVGFVHLALS